MEVKKYEKIEDTLKGVQASVKNPDWYENTEASQALEIARRLRRTKVGMYSSVPIICRATECPYAASCDLVQMDIAPLGQKCPVEIAALEDLFERYCRDMSIDPEDPEQQVDAIMVKDLVDLDIGMLRCEKKIGISADYIIENVVGVSDNHEPITKKEIDPIAEFKERLRAQKYKTLNLLNSTRKDKFGTIVSVKTDPTQRAADLMASMKTVDMKDKDKDRENYMKKLELSVGEKDINKYKQEEVEEAIIYEENQE